jgi:hypothetical protein
MRLVLPPGPVHDGSTWEHATSSHDPEIVTDPQKTVRFASLVHQLPAGGLMNGQHYQEYFSPTAAGPDQVQEEDWQDRLRRLQQLIGELLVKNQQLRMSLESTKALIGETRVIGNTQIS